ncbi:MAG TPA: hypothetical protein VFE19_14835, partial [Jatrophihabitantaceae bacterium]|nr:hypothetical protein [Jatrophihabitantaceae bacterium]
TRRDILFDIRTIIAALFGGYGIICLIWGLAFNGATDRARSGNININLWAGIGMLIFGACFAAWALARPLVPPDAAEPDTDQKESSDSV